ATERLRHLIRNPEKSRQTKPEEDPMSLPARFRSSSPRTRAIALVAIAIALLALAVGGISMQGAVAKPTKRVATKAHNETLDKTILTPLGGRTLYSLSAETNGRFICTGACLKEWFPLTVPAGTRPIGPVKLGTIVRPDGGKTQVTYKGRPLYHFDGDRK